MNLPLSTTLILLFLLALDGIAASSCWPQFRGPNGAGVAEEARPPVHFGADTNLLWKTAVPPGLSAPVVWGDRLFLTAHTSNQLVTLAFDARNGRELWRRAAPAEKIESCHQFSSPAASTPCTDGQRVFAYFGSFGLLAYDYDGQEVWRRPFPRLPIQYGTASSPMLAGGRLTAYDLAEGKPRWWVRGWGFTSVTTPVAANGYIYTVNESGAFTVLRAGDLLDVAAVNKLGESVRATPAIAGDTLYVRSAGHLWAFSEKQPAKR